jgi:hypothetical protein
VVTCSGTLTDKQEKIKEKIHKKEWKIQNMKKEVDAIKKKENTAGGLTPGQQMQMGKNEQVRTNAIHSVCKNSPR